MQLSSRSQDNIEVDSKDEDGCSPLSYAIEEGHKAVVNMLVMQDNIEVKTKGKVDRTLLRGMRWW